MLFRHLITINTQGELWSPAQFVRRLREIRDLRSYSLTIREVASVLRMAYDDIRMQRWGLQAKLVHANTATDRSDLFYLTSPVEARRLLQQHSMTQQRANKKQRERGHAGSPHAVTLTSHIHIHTHASVHNSLVQSRAGLTNRQTGFRQKYRLRNGC